MKHNYTNLSSLFLAIASCLCISVSGQTTDETEDKTQFSIYGFGRTNFTWDNQDLGRSDIFKPGDIVVGAEKNSNFFISARQTRFGFDVKHFFGEDELEIKLEGDFHDSSSDATGNLRLRHAFAKYKFILVGMTWSNFFDIQANPVTVDFEGPNSSTLSRTPQVRFFTHTSKNVFSVSLENPIEKVTISDPIEVLPQRYPDLIAAYRINGDFGFVKTAGVLREIRYESDKPRSLVGYGLTVMSLIHAGEKDKIRLQGIIGTGIARYIEGASGLNYDAIYDGTNELETLQMYGGFFSYQHFWKEAVYSSFTAGYLGVEDNPNLLPTDYKIGYYGSANVFWSMVKNLTFGAEVLVGERKNVNDQTGTAVRFQMNATYKFNKIFK